MHLKTVEESYRNRQAASTRPIENTLVKESAADSFPGPLAGNIIWA